MTDFLKKVGTNEVARDYGCKHGCKQTSKLISTGPQNAASNPIRLS